MRTAEEIYATRKSRREHPDGTFDKAGRWYPSEAETCECCKHIRPPSRGWPYSLMVHCRTMKHIRNLVKKRGE